MICTQRTALLSSSALRTAHQAHVGRKWAAWGKRADFGVRGRGLMFGDAMWWSEDAQAWFPRDLFSADSNKVQWGLHSGYLVIGAPGEPNRYEGFDA